VSCIRVRWLIDDNVFALTMLMYRYVVAELYRFSGCIILPCFVLGIIDKLFVRISNNNIYTFYLVTVRCSEIFLKIYLTSALVL